MNEAQHVLKRIMTQKMASSRKKIAKLEQVVTYRDKLFKNSILTFICDHAFVMQAGTCICKRGSSA